MSKNKKEFQIKSTQYPSPFEGDLLKLWRSDIKKINSRWRRMYSDYVFIKQVVDGVFENPDSDGSYLDLFYLSEMYFTNSLCIEIRNTVDSRSEVISIKGILESMYVHNEFFTLERSVEVTGKEKYLDKEYMIDWRMFTEKNNEDFISKRKLLGKITELIDITSPVIKYTNKNLTHFSRKNQSKKVTACYTQIWDAANYILKLLKELDFILNFTEENYLEVPQYDKFGHLYVPFWKEEYKPKNYFDEQEKFVHWTDKK